MKNLRGDFLAVAIVILFGGTIYALFKIDFPDSSRDVLLVVVGALVGIVKDVYGFEFGSSKDSQRNTQALVDAAKLGNGTAKP